jgi:hypothetical protein
VGFSSARFVKFSEEFRDLVCTSCWIDVLVGVKLLMKTACKITTISMPMKKDNLHIMSICLEGFRVSLIPALGVQSKL